MDFRILREFLQTFAEKNGISTKSVLQSGTRRMPGKNFGGIAQDVRTKTVKEDGLISTKKKACAKNSSAKRKNLRQNRKNKADRPARSFSSEGITFRFFALCCKICKSTFRKSEQKVFKNHFTERKKTGIMKKTKSRRKRQWIGSKSRSTRCRP